MKHPPYSVVTGSPCNDPKGRWHVYVGGGINVSLTVRINTEKAQAEDNLTTAE